MSLKIFNTKFYYEKISNPILDIDDLEFKSGLNFLIGDNGSGKSTFLKGLGNFEDDVKVLGNIKLNGKILEKDDVGTVSQNPQRSINLDLTFIENLILSYTRGWRHLSLYSQINKSSELKVINFLDKFKNRDFLKSLMYKNAKDLSSGQQQILSILMRLVHSQKVLLLDESTANLDRRNNNIIIGILLELAREGTIIIFATHQPELLKTEKTIIYKIRNGKIRKTKK